MKQNISYESQMKHNFNELVRVGYKIQTYNANTNFIIIDQVHSYSLLHLNLLNPCLYSFYKKNWTVILFLDIF